MTLQQLRYVIQAADSRSMNEAAKALYISQPSLSEAIKELEKEIGIELFKRSSHRPVSASRKPLYLSHQGKEKIQRVDAALQFCRKGVCGAGEAVWYG